MHILSSVSICLWIVANCGCRGNEHEDDYTDDGTSNFNILENDTFNEENFLRVNPYGEVMRFHMNPTEWSEDDLIERITKKKIIGGKISSGGAVPFQISIQFRRRHVCGGSIYNSITILTAAHCYFTRAGKMSSDDIKSLVYVAGEFDVGVNERTEQKKKSDSVIIHPGYRRRFNFNDIAIVKLISPLTYNKYVQPLPIDKPPPLVPGNIRTAMVSGWGYTLVRKNNRQQLDGKYFPYKLKEAIVHVFEKTKCLNSFKKIRWLTDLIEHGHIW